MQWTFDLSGGTFLLAYTLFALAAYVVLWIGCEVAGRRRSLNPRSHPLVAGTPPHFEDTWLIACAAGDWHAVRNTAIAFAVTVGFLRPVEGDPDRFVLQPFATAENVRADDVIVECLLAVAEAADQRTISIGQIRRAVGLRAAIGSRKLRARLIEAGMFQRPPFDLTVICSAAPIGALLALGWYHAFQNPDAGNIREWLLAEMLVILVAVIAPLWGRKTARSHAYVNWLRGALYPQCPSSAFGADVRFTCLSVAVGNMAPASTIPGLVPILQAHEEWYHLDIHDSDN